MTLRTPLSVLCGIFIVQLLISVAAFPAPSQAAKVLVNIWDGSEYVVIRDRWQAGDLPNLRSLGALGQTAAVLPCFGNGRNSCMRGVTKDQHATMLTGYLADAHGVYDNKIYQQIPKGMTVYEKLRAAYGNNIRIAHLSGKCANFGFQTFKNAMSATDVFMDCVAGRVGDYGLHPEEVVAEAVTLINQWESQGVQNYFIVAHFDEPDVTGHHFSVNSKEYRKAVQNNDALLGRMLDVLPQDAEVFVTSDHGFGNLDFYPVDVRMDSHWDRSSNTLFARRGHNAPEQHYMNDFAPIWLGLFGLDLDGKPLTASKI